MTSSYSLVAQGCDLDSLGHINNSVYLKYLESARWDFFYQSGLLDSFNCQKLLLVVLETKIRYIREIKIFDNVEVKTVWECTDGIMINKHRLVNSKNGELFAKAECKLAFIDQNRVVHDIPEEIKTTIR
ncbi:MAG: thioesterase family protein [Oscillospiraceae bacterium]|nr:thioesterase family protein [Oscillospiraceae bacterium]